MYLGDVFGEILFQLYMHVLSTSFQLNSYTERLQRDLDCGAQSQSYVTLQHKTEYVWIVLLDDVSGATSLRQITIGPLPPCSDHRTQYPNVMRHSKTTRDMQFSLNAKDLLFNIVSAISCSHLDQTAAVNPAWDETTRVNAGSL